MQSREAKCTCGSVTMTPRGEPGAVVMCHCKDWQRRTGSHSGWEQSKHPWLHAEGISHHFPKGREPT